jgi:hypothetical protein
LDDKSPKGDGKAAPKSKAENNSSLGEGNQSEPPKPEHNSSQGGGKAATDTANKPKATKFTPEMVKAAFEAAIKQNPNLFTEKEKARALAQMQEPKAVQGMTDELNKNISGGKIIDFEGMNVDEITVEALTKGVVAMMPQARKEGNQWNSYMKISDIESALSGYLFDNMGEFGGTTYPAADKWCDALLKAAVAGNLKDIPPKAVKKDGAVFIEGGRANFPNDKVLLFECDLGWNGSGGLEDALKYMEKYKLEKIVVAFVGFVEPPEGSPSRWRCTKEELKKLNW